MDNTKVFTFQLSNLFSVTWAQSQQIVDMLINEKETIWFNNEDEICLSQAE